MIARGMVWPAYTGAIEARLGDSGPLGRLTAEERLVLAAVRFATVGAPIGAQAMDVLLADVSWEALGRLLVRLRLVELAGTRAAGAGRSRAAGSVRPLDRPHPAGNVAPRDSP